MFSEENKKIKLILASASPRRSDILNLFKINFEAISPSGCYEEKFINPYDTAIKNSIKKSKNIFDYVKINKLKILEGNNYNDILICGFDTIVYFKDKYYLKPQNINEAKNFLSIFSGKTHSVITGLCVLSSIKGIAKTDIEETKVTFRKLSKEDIDWYLLNENVLDKAGGYNINGLGALLIKKINGCFFNVAGLPIYKFLKILNEFGYNLCNLYL
jgi:septum formation protein